MKKTVRHHVDKDFNTFGAESKNESFRIAPIPEIIFQPHWGKAEELTYETSNAGGHGRGDIRLLNDLFRGVKDNSLGHSANYVDGAWSILTGIAANISIAEGRPVRTESLVRF